MASLHYYYTTLHHTTPHHTHDITLHLTDWILLELEPQVGGFTTLHHTTIHCTALHFADWTGLEHEPQVGGASAPKSLTGKACYKDNEWLKGSNGIFEGIFGGGAGETPGRVPRPPSGPGIGGNFNRRVGQIG